METERQRTLFVGSAIQFVKELIDRLIDNIDYYILFRTEYKTST